VIAIMPSMFNDTKLRLIENRNNFCVSKTEKTKLILKSSLSYPGPKKDPRKILGAYCLTSAVALENLFLIDGH
jgi:hypothetical protein